MNVWLLGTYVTLLLGRGMLIVLQNAYNLYQRWVLACSAVFTFLVLFPFLLIWTILGTVWFVEIASTSSVTCVSSIQLPEAERSWLIVMWLAVCYMIIVVLLISTCAVVAMTIRERRLQQQILAGELANPFVQLHSERLMTAEEMILLDRYQITLNVQSENMNTCTICYEEFEVRDKQIGEKVVRLPECKHIFHPKCIRDWLKIKPICPYCKNNVISAMGL